MTGLLKDLMHDRADRLAQPVLDLDAISRDGDRRVRRRRATYGAIALTAVVATGATLPSLLDNGTSDARQPDVAVGESSSVVYATGSTIHVGDESLDVGHEVHSFIQVGDAFVFTDPDGKVFSWADGRVTAQGASSDDGYGGNGAGLVGDTRWAGWIADAPRGLAATFVDLRTGEHQAVSVTAGGAETVDPRVWAIDGDTAYVGDLRGLVEVDLLTAETRVLRGAGPSFEMADAQDGVLLFRYGIDEGDDANGVTVASTDPNALGAALPIGNRGDLSPDGRYVMSENSAESSDDFTLAEVDGGRVIPVPEKADYSFFTGYAWTGPHSYMALAIPSVLDDKRPEFHLLSCEVGGACTVAREGLRWSEVQLPLGEHLGN